MTPAENQRVARLIMGESFIGVGHEFRLMRDLISPADVMLLERASFPLELLKEMASDHTLVAVPSCPLQTMQEACPELFHYKLKERWYQPLHFNHATGRAHWALFPNNLVALNSQSKSLGEQRQLLEDGWSMPSARVLVYVLLLRYLIDGVRLLPDVVVRTEDTDVRDSSLHIPGEPVNIGLFDEVGIHIGHGRSDHRFSWQYASTCRVIA